MALHGEVKLNGVVLASWEAIRVSGDAAPDSVNDYLWTLAEAGTPVTPTRSRMLQHRYGDGAVALASKVLAAAGES